MTTVSILPIATEHGGIAYRAVSGGCHREGKTAGEALDALASELGDEATNTLVIVRHHRPDEFFTAEQVARLEALMSQWRAARDTGTALSADEQTELDTLLEAELRAAANRAATIADELGR